MPLLQKDDHMRDIKHKDEKRGGGVGGASWTLMGGEYHMIDATNQR
jgi:ATP-dependent Lon protease